MKQIVLFVFFLLGISFSMQASHLVGGDISYECLGNNQYKIRLNVYRDCQSTGQGGTLSPFDNPARLTVFTGNGTVYSVNPPQQSLSVNYSASSPSVIAIDLSNPCLVPPTNVCVDEAVYETTITLPYNPLGYHITYQRCCRNNTIANIANPGSTGATYTTYISDIAQTGCNRNPQFNNFPPVVICQNQPIDFDHGATDADGDSLIYSFCAPSTGASSNSPAPNVAQAPPYAAVSFLSPYTASAPLASNIVINPQTGFITGSPALLGQYVVGICVDEYRNGVWIGSIKRDFQFNVTVCAVSIQASLVSDTVTTGNSYTINTCEDSTIFFDNQSGLPQYISGYLWEFNLNNGTTYTTTDASPTVTFPTYGSYVGRLIVNPGTTGCSDTAYVYANVHQNPVASFNYTYDSCVLGPINFTSTSIANEGTLAAWDWDFGDDSTMYAINPSYQYQEAGTFNTRLLVTDSNGCVDSTMKTVTWAPTPIIEVVPSTASGCIPLDVLFENNSYPINGYDLFWTLGDGYTSTVSDPVHVYQDTGLYTVTVVITSPLGCVATDTFINLVNVRNPPKPNFYMLYDSCAYSPVEFYNTSKKGDGNIIQWAWAFEDSTINSIDTNTTFLYSEVGAYQPTLTITDDNDCVLSITKPLDWQPAPVFPVTFPATFVGCQPQTIEIEDTTYPLPGYFTLWNFGDGYYSDVYNDTHYYKDSGTYDLKLYIISRTACTEEFVFPQQVVVNGNPVASFSYLPEEPSLFEPTVEFFDNSGGAIAWEWFFGDGEMSVQQNPVHTYQDTGLHIVTLVVTHATGCQDTIQQMVDIKPTFTYFLPNAFTPNDDGKNDGYRGVGEMFAVSNFRLQIWSRWGELMFETTDPTEAWNGRKNNTGTMVGAGVYVSLATMTGPRGEKYEYKGFATVVK